jgi:hypothetical protein
VNCRSAITRLSTSTIALLAAVQAAGAQCPQTDCCAVCDNGTDNPVPQDTDDFGMAVAVDGFVALIGAPLRAGMAGDQGVAFVYTFDGSAWNEGPNLQASDGADGDHLGHVVGLSGNLAIAGAYVHDALGPDSGAAYVFDRTNGNQLAKLVPPVAPADNYQFGQAVAIDGTTAVVGAPGADDGTGAVYVFDGQSSWAQVATLTAVNGTDTDQFGLSVAIDGNVIVVGAPGDDDGEAFVYEKSGGQWSNATEDANLMPSDGTTVGDAFGWSLDVSGSRIVVGAPFHDEGTTIDGAAYVFEEPPGGWAGTLSQPRSMVGCDEGTQPVDFGFSVAIEARVVIVGSRRDTGPDTGRAHAFRFFSGADPQWRYLKALTQQDGAAGDLMGWSVALSGGLAVVGAPGHDIGGGFYEFQGFGGCPGPGDIDDDGTIGINDFLDMLAAWGSNPGHPADLNGDDEVGINDFLILLGNWGPCACD